MTFARRHLRFEGCSVDLLTREVRRGSGSARLSSQEEQLLRCLARADGAAVSRETLLTEVWGYRPGIESRAPDVAIRRLRTKLEDDPSSPVRVCTVLGQGWALRGLQDAPRRRPDDPAVIGREEVVARVDAILDETGSACLVGPPGVGTSTVAQRVLSGRPERAVTVSLEGVDDEAGLLTAVARALGTPLAHVADAGEHLASVIDGPSVLLHLDPVGAVAPWLERWLPRWGCQVLLVGHAAVNVPGVTVVPVRPLASDDAARLFCQVAGVSDDDTVRALVRGLDGLPLAVRLAAGRARAVGVGALLGDEGVRYERVAAPGLSDGLVEALGRAWDELDADEQAVLVALSAFEGPFDLALAEAVAPDGWIGPVLERLEARSLIQLEHGDTLRYRLLGGVRWWASRQGQPDVARLAEALIAHGAAASLATWRAVIRLARRELPDRVAALVCAADDLFAEALPFPQRRELLEQAPDALEVRRRLAWVSWRVGDRDGLAGVEQVRADAEAAGDVVVADRALVDLCGARRAGRSGVYDAVEALKAALQRAREPELRIALLTELADQHQDLGAWREARVALQQALAITGDERTRARLLCALGHVAVNQGRTGEALAALEQAVQAGPLDGLLGERVHRTLGGLRFVGGDPEGAVADIERALELARQLGLWRQYAATVGNLGIAWADLGDTVQARALIEEALARSRELGEGQTEVRSLVNLGRLVLLEDLVEARELLREGMARAEAHGWARLASHARLNLAIADQLEGHDASEALREVLAEAHAAGDRRVEALAAAHLACHDPAALAHVEGDRTYEEVVRALRGEVREAERGDARLILAVQARGCAIT